MNNDMFNELNEEITSEKLEEAINEHNNIDKQLTMSILSIFMRKKQDNEKLLHSLASMVMLNEILSIGKPDFGIPAPTEAARQAKALSVAIDEVISAIQKYSIEYEKFSMLTIEHYKEIDKFKDNNDI